MTKKLLFLAGDFVDSLSIYAPWYALRAMGFQVDIVSPGK
jgi:putative intracellular protease/amidase